MSIYAIHYKLYLICKINSSLKKCITIITGSDLVHYENLHIT